MASYTVDAQRIFEALLKHHRGETGEPYGHFMRLRRYDWEPLRFMARLDHMDVFPHPTRYAPGLVYIVVAIIGHDRPDMPSIGAAWPNGCRCIDLAEVLLDRIETFE